MRLSSWVGIELDFRVHKGGLDAEQHDGGGGSLGTVQVWMLQALARQHAVRDLVVDIAEGRQPRPSFADGLQVQRVLAAVEASAANGSAWTNPADPSGPSVPKEQS